ncbi:hypothetical protein K435DRAFT_772877 [Dendrothele bispora CBS 962.96]|uniref:Uncharacterized protein n=1 Tax=Dendrothele bispora (strain CBS 962.96) TaxID=1314807 RepID=A0A4S8MUU2_DENBC|nr:hypothetical protein K435DRAFT_772877 [Dendrothele bispora CBS 962.96]
MAVPYFLAVALSFCCSCLYPVISLAFSRSKEILCSLGPYMQTPANLVHLYVYRHNEGLSSPFFLIVFASTYLCLIFFSTLNEPSN